MPKITITLDIPEPGARLPAVVYASNSIQVFYNKDGALRISDERHSSRRLCKQVSDTAVEVFVRDLLNIPTHVPALHTVAEAEKEGAS